jgi:DnaJ-class molecular chaperone
MESVGKNAKSEPKDSGKYKECPRCKGTGYIETVYYDLTKVGDEVKKEVCILCDGTGKLPENE